MTEGKGYCARRQESTSLKNLAKFIEKKDNIIVIPDIIEEKALISNKLSWLQSRKTKRN